MAWPTCILVTGATGFIGAHVVDTLLSRGFRVRGTTRSKAKANAMLAARPGATQASLPDFKVIGDFSSPDVDVSAALEDGIDAVIHVASPFTYDTKDNEAELILPAINGVKAVLSAAAGAGTVQRVVVTSSFAAVLDVDRVQKATKYFTYTAGDWNPLTYEEAANAETSAVVAYRGSKKFAELAAWGFVNNFGGSGGRSSFDIVILCPPMTFGPVVHPVVGGPLGLNDSNSQLWKVAIALQEGIELPVARVPFWVDVRDLAEAHVEALLRPEAGGQRYLVASPERFSYGMAAKVIESEFRDFRRRGAEEVRTQIVDGSHGIDGETAARELGIKYRAFRETVIDLVRQAAAHRTGANRPAPWRCDHSSNPHPHCSHDLIDPKTHECATKIALSHNIAADQYSTWTMSTSFPVAFP